MNEQTPLQHHTGPTQSAPQALLSVRGIVSRACDDSLGFGPLELRVTPQSAASARLVRGGDAVEVTANLFGSTWQLVDVKVLFASVLQGSGSGQITTNSGAGSSSILPDAHPGATSWHPQDPAPPLKALRINTSETASGPGISPDSVVQGKSDAQDQSAFSSASNRINAKPSPSASPFAKLARETQSRQNSAETSPRDTVNSGSESAPDKSGGNTAAVPRGPSSMTPRPTPKPLSPNAAMGANPRPAFDPGLAADDFRDVPF